MPGPTVLGGFVTTAKKQGSGGAESFHTNRGGGVVGPEISPRQGLRQQRIDRAPGWNLDSFVDPARHVPTLLTRGTQHPGPRQQMESPWVSFRFPLEELNNVQTLAPVSFRERACWMA
jgi:hypothetical protein